MILCQREFGNVTNPFLGVMGRASWDGTYSMLGPRSHIVSNIRSDGIVIVGGTFRRCWLDIVNCLPQTLLPRYAYRQRCLSTGAFLARSLRVGCGKLCHVDSRLLCCCLAEPFTLFRLVGIVREAQGIEMLQPSVRPKLGFGLECIHT